MVKIHCNTHWHSWQLYSQRTRSTPTYCIISSLHPTPLHTSTTHMHIIGQSGPSRTAGHLCPATGCH